MYKRTIFGVALAPAFALGVALTAYAANGWHGSPSAMQDRAPTHCEATPAGHVERPDAVGYFDLSVNRQAQKLVRPVLTAPCPGTTDRG